MKRTFATALIFTLAGSAFAAPLPGLPPGPLGQAIQRGHDMMMATGSDPESKPYVGNALSCNSCHTNAGDTGTPGNFRGTALKFPAYSPREGAVITLEDRIANCFMRSMNGTRPSADSQVVVDMAVYISWLDRGKSLYPATPAAPPSPYPAMLKAATRADLAAGATLYSSTCAACHGATGAGMPGAFPPVWGANSYNAGAGLANVGKLAGWVKGNMPLGNANLSDKQALDVALYIDSQPRPDFGLRAHLSATPTPDNYNATVTTETDTVAGNLKKAGLTPLSRPASGN
jgi:thiosulfate dehydrogenase